jgi:anti-sigma regulatory factor (Ser/Thr protein kinase)
LAPAPRVTERRGFEIRTLIDLTFAAGPAAASEARKSLNALAGKVSQDKFEDIRLLVSELVTNSVRHAGFDTEDGVGFRVRLGDRCLRVDVVDSGKGFEKTVTPSMPDQVSGWGLQIVEKLSDRWGVEPMPESGSAVWFEIDL